MPEGIHKSSRLSGIDAIRFIAAFTVVLSHFGAPPVFQYLNAETGILHVVSGIYNNLFCGSAAVIVFFVISGLVIHYPNRHKKKINIPEFYVKRYIRILVPMGTAMVLDYYLDAKIEFVLWSLYAELIYYTLYPVLLALKQRIGWNALLYSSFALALAIVFALYPSSRNGLFHESGIFFSSIIGLPVWMLGAKIAEDTTVFSFMNIFRKNLNLLRTGIWILSMAVSISYFHLGIPQTMSLLVFSLAVFCWLPLEIERFSISSPNSFLEKSGKWSYSLYLCHYLALAVLEKIEIILHDPFSNWLLLMSFILLFSFCYYLLVERPSHRLAQKIKIA